MGLIYIDMDGVLAQFEQAPNAMNRFVTEHDFFLTLEPTKYAKTLANRQMSDKVYILTSSPHEQADRAKRAWIAIHLPQLKDRVVCVRSGQEKAKYAKGNTLIDDYTDNLKHWVAKGGKAIKALNGLNGKGGSYKEITHSFQIVD